MYLLFLVTLWLQATTLICKKPNIVVFLTDDQDVLLNSLTGLEYMNDLFVDNGLQFVNGFTSTPVCCVSRSSILTGKLVQNHFTINNTISGNCFSESWVTTQEPYTFNTFLHNNGYKTYYSGKYLNQYGNGNITSNGIDLTCKHVPTGWDEWFVNADGAKYFDYTLSHNGEIQTHGYDYNKDYFPRLQQQNAINFLENLNLDLSFLMVVSTPAAHYPWTPDEIYMDIIEDSNLKAPRKYSYNYAGINANYNYDKGITLRNRDIMSSIDEDESDYIYRLRHATLLSVDTMVNKIYNKILDINEIDNTYFIYLSDHGFHLGQYGMKFGKKLLYESNIRIPFFISGPNVRIGESKILVSNIDIGPTIIDLSLGYVPDSMDGNSLVPYLTISSNDEINILENKKQSFLISYFGESGSDDNGKYTEFQTCETEDNIILDFDLTVSDCDAFNNTYTCIRQISSNSIAGEIFCVYTCYDDSHNEVDCDTIYLAETKGEYYNLDIDSEQLYNTIEDLSDEKYNYFIQLIETYSDCKGSTCRDMRTTDNNDNTVLISSHNTNSNGLYHKFLKSNIAVIVILVGILPCLAILCVVGSVWLRKCEDGNYDYYTDYNKYELQNINQKTSYKHNNIDSQYAEYSKLLDRT